MTKQQAQKALEKIGFRFPVIPRDPVPESLYGTITPETVVNVGKNTFHHRNRDVYVTGLNRWPKDKNFYYITSHIRGTLHHYRTRYYHDHDADFLNIFASGKTRGEAVRAFIHNFQNRIYNDGSRGGEIGMVEGSH